MLHGEDGLYVEPWVGNGEHILGRLNYMSKLQKAVGNVHRKRTASNHISVTLSVSVVGCKVNMPYSVGKMAFSCIAKDIRYLLVNP